MEYHDQIAKDLNSENFNRMKILSFIFFALGIFNLVIDYSPGNPWDENVIQYYKFLDFLLLIISLSLYFISILFLIQIQLLMFILLKSL